MLVTQSCFSQRSQLPRFHFKDQFHRQNLQRRQGVQTATRYPRTKILQIANAATFYDYQLKNIDCKQIDLKQYAGKVILVVNVASACGFTPQYTGLQQLYDKYRGKGFEILAFPCNQFGGQEPGSNSEIKKFAQRKGAKFSIMDKVDVNGGNQEPLFKYLKNQKGGWFNRDIKWNFSKFLIDRDGKVVDRFGSMTTPEMLDEKIAALL
eukprot:TRINITY_DN51784_c0_g1_i1.p1 TRINITY_DN51784_c0_g1~~TRINITY_DN51784_c0_g1_i1.p1  ORF type:complete len:227 (+),score=20.65 TRINITY_DN51784_c0_g1_i1:59-682(+)